MEVMTAALVAGLRGHPGLVTMNIDTQASRSLAEKGGKHQLRKSIRGAAQTLRVLIAVARFRPDIVYLPLTSSPSFLGFLRDSLLLAPGLACGKKVMVHLHNGSYAYAEVTGVKRVLVRSVLSRVTMAVVLGDRLHGVFGPMIPRDRIACIPNGVDGGPFEVAKLRLRTRPRARGRARVLFVGLMHRGKGFRDLVEAIPLVPEAEFVFAGEWGSPSEEREVRHFLRERRLEDRVQFAGVVTGDAKYDLFLSADVFVLPSYYEGLPLVVLEALASGLPIVCTDCGALDSAVRDGWNGFFVPPAAPQAIAARLNELLGQPDMRHIMGQRSRAVYEEKFTLRRFLASFSEAIQRCGGRARCA
jgi:glycosyltransferase involved in cell wall biosynthesis